MRRAQLPGSQEITSGDSITDKLAEKVAARQAELEAEMEKLSQYGNSAKKSQTQAPAAKARKSDDKNSDDNKSDHKNSDQGNQPIAEAARAGMIGGRRMTRRPSMAIRMAVL